MVIVFTLILITVLSLIYLYLSKEGYKDDKDVSKKSKDQEDYDNLRAKLKKTLQPYCSLTKFVQAQLKTMYMSDKLSDVVIPAQTPPEGGVSRSIESLGSTAQNLAPALSATPEPTTIRGETEAEANAHIMRTYNDVYNCADDLADSRPSCKGYGIARNMKLGAKRTDQQFVPCSVYMDLPEYSENNLEDITIALSKIPDNLTERIKTEIEWYAVAIEKLGAGLDEGKNPPAGEAQCGRKNKKEGYADVPAKGKMIKDDDIFTFERATYNRTMETTNIAKPIPKDDSKAAGAGAGAGAGGAGGPLGNTGCPYGPTDFGGMGGIGGIGSNAAGVKSSSNAVCSPAAAQARKELIRRRKLAALEAEAASCKLPDISAEINRVNKLLNSKDLQDVLGVCKDLEAKAKILELNLAALKNGNYYDWQKTGESKTYQTFKITDRTSGFIASVQQNQ
jgi:hypothetical protein